MHVLVIVLSINSAKIMRIFNQLRMLILALILTFAVVDTLNSAEKEKEKESKKWDVNNPPGTYKETEFMTNEGTWMNLDVSPDGKTLIFDMLGDIYMVPSQGGEAKVIRQGLAWEVQPRFSPDGKKISFTSDAGGGDNIWIMNADGTDPKQITKEDFRLLNNAVWTPDGQYLIARKHFTAERSAGAGEIWMYHISGGAGIGLTKRKNDQQDCGEPFVDPSGRYVYYSEDMSPGGRFEYNKDPNKQIYVIKRYDREKGETETVVGGPGGAFRPVVSHDGKKLAYVKRVRTKTVLYIYDLETGEQMPIYDDLAKDQQEAWALFGVYTNFNFSPDDKQIYIWAKGWLFRINIEDQAVKQIPILVKAKHRIYDAVKVENQVFTDKFNAKAIRNLVTSPDNKFVVFNAAGYLWKKSLPNGVCERLTNSKDFEFEPAFSPDGKELVYVTWNDSTTGTVQKYNLVSKSSKAITIKKGIYRNPSFSPDASKVVFLKEDGNDHQGFTYCNDPGIYWISANGSDAQNPHLISKEGEFPIFNKDGSRVFYQTGGYLFGALEKGFHSVDLSGNEKRTHFTSKYTNRFVPSPDNKWIAFNELHKAYVAVFPESGKSIDLSSTTNSVPVAQLTKDAGINLHWSNDSKKINWTLGDQYFSNEIVDRFKFLKGENQELKALDSVGLNLDLQIKTDVPNDVLAFTNVKVITMNKKNEIIENATVVVENNKIKSIGVEGQVSVPSNAKLFDMTGKVMMPGLVDVHAHLGTFRYGISPQKHWQYWANLAYGVTTTHDPSSNTEMVFSQSEMIKAGYMVGPRVYSTGIILYGADGDFKAPINSLEDALSALRRTKAFGAFSVKSYNQPRRDQRQQVIEAARELGMMVVPEGGSHFQHNMSMIADGHTGIEHNIPVGQLYIDVVNFWKKSKTAYTPTLIVDYGAVSGEYYWYQKHNVWEEDKLLRYTPRAVIDSRSRHRTIIPEEEYQNGHILTSQSVNLLADSGVKINLGAHGQLQGLGAHWEMWMLAQGGMSNMNVLRSATINGAEYIGMDKEIGSVEEGKLADLIILDKDPLEDIQNTKTVRNTIINGRIYDTWTMNQIGTNRVYRSKFYWENAKYNMNFKWHEETDSFNEVNCSCGH